MHIPENYLSPQTCAVMTAAVVPAWVHAARKVKAEIPRERMPLLGVGAAFSFVSMMFNIPLPGGTTGHAVGGTLIALLLGPDAACLAVTVALLIQALLFGDGGILSFGANCFNIAFVLPYVGYGVCRLVSRFLHGEKGKTIGAALGAYAGINAAAFCAALEFGVQPYLFQDASGQALYCPYGLEVAVPAMMAGHLTLFGLAELVFTVAVYSFVSKVSPGSLRPGEPVRRRPVYWLLAGLICLVPLGLLAEGTAWGEWGADEIAATAAGGVPLGYTPAGMESGFSLKALLPDYSVAGLPELLGYLLSAVIGAALAVILFRLAAGAMKEKTDYAG